MFPFLRPDMPSPEKWIGIVNGAYERRYFSNFGPINAEFEAAISESIGNYRYSAVSCANATSGLLAALQSLDLEAGAKVLIPSFTFAGSVQAILAAGCQPVLCDVDDRRWDLTLDILKDALKSMPDIQAVMAVRPFGFWRDLSDIEEFSNSQKLPLIVDAAAGFNGEAIRNLSYRVEVFSFHATKPFAVGEGGAIIAPTEKAAKIRRVLNFGFTNERTFSSGFNGKLDEVHAAIGLAAFDGFANRIQRRATMAKEYDDFFQTRGRVALPIETGAPPWQCYPVRILDGDIELTQRALHKAGVQTRRYYWPSLGKGAVNSITNRIQSLPTPTTNSLSEQMLCFPIYSDTLYDNRSVLFEILADVISN